MVNCPVKGDPLYLPWTVQSMETTCGELSSLWRLSLYLWWTVQSMEILLVVNCPVYGDSLLVVNSPDYGDSQLVVNSPICGDSLFLWWTVRSVDPTSDEFWSMDSLLGINCGLCTLYWWRFVIYGLSYWYKLWSLVSLMEMICGLGLSTGNKLWSMDSLPAKNCGLLKKNCGLWTLHWQWIAVYGLSAGENLWSMDSLLVMNCGL